MLSGWCSWLAPPVALPLVLAVISGDLQASELPLQANDSAEMRRDPSFATSRSQLSNQPAAHLQPVPVSLTGFVVPVQMVKLTLAPPDASNRLELNHFQPLHRSNVSILFSDQTLYAKARPSGEAGAGLPVVETLGQSFRMGYRTFTTGGRGFVGFNAGYDNSWQQGYFFQQLGVGLEATYPGLAVAATGTHAVGRLYYASLGNTILSSFNIQAAFPTGIPHVSMATRYYYVSDRLGQSAPGGQIQLSYGLNHALTMTLSASYDNLDGAGSSLQFKYLFHAPQPSQVPPAVPYGIALPFSQAIGNTGSRIIRLTGSAPAYGD